MLLRSLAVFFILDTHILPVFFILRQSIRLSVKNSFGRTICIQLKIMNRHHYLIVKSIWLPFKQIQNTALQQFSFYETNKFGIPLSRKFHKSHTISHVSTVCLSLVFCHSTFFWIPIKKYPHFQGKYNFCSNLQSPS